jgi:SNF2 family DNA or RNA helicase
VSPFILRREKDKVLRQDSAADAGSSSSSAAAAGGGDGTSPAGGLVVAASNTSRAAAAAASAPRPAAMGSKTDLVVWLRLTPLQRHVYEAFLHSDAVKAALNSTRSPLAALTVLKKVCDHPALLSERATKLVVTGGWCCGCWCWCALLGCADFSLQLREQQAH